MANEVGALSLSPADRLRAAIKTSRLFPLRAPAQPGERPVPEPVRTMPAYPHGRFEPQAPRAGLRSEDTPDLFKKAPKPKAVKPHKSVTKDKGDPTPRVLKALGLQSVQEMLLCVPSDYSDCRDPITNLAGFADGFRGLFFLRRTGHVEAVDAKGKLVPAGEYNSIFEAPYKGYWEHIRQVKVQLVDEGGHFIWLGVFNPWKLKEKDPHGHILVEGVLDQFGAKRFITSASEPPIDVAGKVWVRYVCPGAPAEADVRTLVDAALLDAASYDTAAHKLVTSSLLSEAQLLEIAEQSSGQRYASLQEFFKDLHEPESPDDGALAGTAARAMAVAGICSTSRASSFRHPSPKAPLNITTTAVDALIASQAETLTADQRTVVQGLVTALRSPSPLKGLLSGDVGTGKTLAFMIPAVAAHMAGAQVAIISPTEILANQVAANVSRRFPQARVERVFAGGKIKDTQAILIGTSGLASVARKAEYTPNFLIVDEQHKLATKDRNSMVGPWTHHLEASATPIPRSLAATLFSGTQVFNLTQAPVERDIESFVMGEAERVQAVRWMREAIDGKQRVAVIYPRVEKSVEAGQGAVKAENASDTSAVVSSVIDAAEALKGKFSGRVGMLHGKMSSQDVVTTLENYRSGVLSMVVASTIMETGIDIPDIRLLVVKSAENFGVAQLHQLRGRLARNGGHARFVMMVADKATLSPETADRLSTVAKVNDGYALAEADMATRGFGDLAGNAQSGNISCAFRLLRLGLHDFEA